MSLGTSVKGSILRRVIESVANSEPKTTLIGAALAGIIAANVDYNKLFQQDPQQIGMLIAAVLVALKGWYTNNHKPAGAQ